MEIFLGIVLLGNTLSGGKRLPANLWNQLNSLEKEVIYNILYQTIIAENCRIVDSIPAPSVPLSVKITKSYLTFTPIADSLRVY
jgi:hypothetical protein